MTHRISHEGVTFIGFWEGKGDGQPNKPGLQVYICPAGVATLGYGHALYHPTTGKMLRRRVYGDKTLELGRQAVIKMYGRDTISDAEAEQLLDDDCDKFEAVVNRYVGNMPTSQAQFDALVSFAFNVGEANFRTSSVLRRHNSMMRQPGNTDPRWLVPQSKASKIASMTEAFCAWSRSEGQWMLGLFRRRYAESLVYFGMDPMKTILRAQQVRV